MDGRTNGWMGDGWIDVWMDGLTNGWMGEWMDTLE